MIIDYKISILLINTLFIIIYMKIESFKNFLLITIIIVGMISYFKSKFQNIQKVQEGGINKNFFHPYMQTFMMFIGEAGCLIIYYIMKSRNQEEYKQRNLKALQQGKRIDLNIFILCIPTICDFTASTLNYFALNFIPGSIYQMFGGSTVVTTLIFTRLIIRKKLKLYQIVGCSCAFVGMIVVGLSTLLFQNTTFAYDVEQQILGYIMLLLSLLLSGLFYAVEQKILNIYYIQPLQMVGFEGIFGVIISSIAIAILTFVHCPFGKNACVYGNDGIAYFQRPQMYFKQFFSNTLLIIIIPIGVITVAAFNVLGLTITKYIDATTRAMMNLVRTIFVWIIGIIVTVSVGKNNTQYKWEQLNVWTIVIESIGFVIISFGVSIYTRKLKLMFIDQRQQENIVKIEEEAVNQSETIENSSTTQPLLTKAKN